MKKILFLIMALMVSTIINAQWQLTSQYIGSVFQMVSNGTDIFAGTSNDGIFLSTDNANSWTQMNNGLTNLNIQSITINGSDIFVGTAAGVFLSTDYGNNWTAKNNGLTNLNVYSIEISGTKIFASTLGGVFQSINNGSSWSNASTNLQIPAGRLTINGTNIFTTVNNYGVFMSPISTVSWNTVNNGLGVYNTYSLFLEGSTLYGGTDNGIYKTTNNGANWYLFSNISIASKIIKNGSNIFVTKNGSTNFGGGIFLSTNNGSSWTTKNDGFPNNTTVYTIALCGSTVFATTADGIWSRQLSEIISSIEENRSQTSLNIFPNPTSDILIIDNPYSENYDLTIKNIQGQIVLNKNVNVAKSNSIDISVLDNGVYFVTLNNGKDIFSNKIVIQK